MIIKGESKFDLNQIVSYEKKVAGRLEYRYARVTNITMHLRQLGEDAPFYEYMLDDSETFQEHEIIRAVGYDDKEPVRK